MIEFHVEDNAAKLECQQKFSWSTVTLAKGLIYNIILYLASINRNRNLQGKNS